MIEADSEAPQQPEQTSSRPPDWLEDGRPPRPDKALPRISVRHVGMHIGGESNSSEAKRPWLEAIEGAKIEILGCYRYVLEPLEGGTFGLDLYVSTKGTVEVRAMRQRLGAQPLEACVKETFEGVEFPRPARPTVLSYSFRFDVTG